MSAAISAAQARDACPMACGICGRCPWLDMVTAPRRRLRGWLAAGAGAVALITGCAALAMIQPEAPKPVALSVTLVPAAVAARAPDIAAISDPAPAVSDAAPERTEAPTDDPLPAPPPPEAVAAPDLPDAAALDRPEAAQDLLPKIDAPPPPPLAAAIPAPPPRPAQTKATRTESKPAEREPARAARAESAPEAAAASAPVQAPAPDAGAGRAADRGAPAAASVTAEEWTGKVVSKIRRVRQRRVRGNGTVTIGFSIGPDGALSALSVLHGSGNPELDQAGLDHIRRAAPFPPPPPGAGSGLSFNFTVR